MNSHDVMVFHSRKPRPKMPQYAAAIAAEPSAHATRTRMLEGMNRRSFAMTSNDVVSGGPARCSPSKGGRWPVRST